MSLRRGARSVVAAALGSMSTVEPPSLGRYLLGCVIMLAAVVAPLALAWLRTTNRGATYSHGLGCVPLATRLRSGRARPQQHAACVAAASAAALALTLACSVQP